VLETDTLARSVKKRTKTRLVTFTKKVFGVRRSWKFNFPHKNAELGRVKNLFHHGNVVIGARTLPVGGSPLSASEQEERSAEQT
jgi:hypothetical protein